ncbi:MAG: sulfotransferase [Gammaproteobacteria bacterium]|nr:sulfotransferase [Gammaproteobacteria bacterium]
MYLINRIRRILKYGLEGIREEQHPFLIPSEPIKASREAIEVARVIRGAHPPALIIHGVMPRSGTVYTGELLRLHPDLHAYPNELWEVPFLELTGDILRTQEHFFRAYKQNIGRMGDKDFLPMFGASLMAYLYSFVPPGKRMLLKIPDVQYLNHFYTVFPYETPLLLLRDGRDLVASTINSWPGKRFDEVCQLWADSARMMLAFQRHYPRGEYKYLTIKYEDVVSAPEGFVTTVCEMYGLDRSIYPYDRIRDLPVRGSSTVKESLGGDVSWDPMDKPDNFRSVGHWREWSSSRKRTFKRISGRVLLETGYCKDLGW